MKKFEKVFFAFPVVGGAIDLCLISLGINTLALASIISLTISACILQRC